jgi:DUF2934 family protein
VRYLLIESISRRLPLNTTPPVSPRSRAFSTAAADRLRPPSDTRALITTDHELIRRWAARHSAEPATGEATVSGPGTVAVNDGGAGVRFNFPGAGRFRPITWDEWFEHFERHHLAFAFDEEVQDRAYEIWQARGAGHGHDRDDWFEAEHQLGKVAEGPSARYRLIKREVEDEKLSHRSKRAR